MKRIILLLAFFICFQSSFAQSENYMETRIEAAVEKEFWNVLELTFSPSIRLGNDFGYDKTILDLGLKYDLMGWFDIGVGGRIRFNETKNRGTEITSRIDLDLSKSFKVGKFSISPRVRYCHYNNLNNVLEWTASNRMRYRLKFGYKHSKNALFRPKVGVELYHLVATNSLDNLRYFVGGTFKLNKNNSIGVAYLLDDALGYDLFIHTVELSYKYKF